MAIPCKSVDEAVQALDGQFGYRKGYDRIQWSKPNDPATWGVDVEGDFDEDAWFLPRNHEASNLTMESLQKAIEDMERLKLERPDMKLTITPKYMETLIPPGWTREMMEDIIYFQDALSEVSFLASGSAEDQPTETPTCEPGDWIKIQFDGKEWRCVEDQSTEESAPTGLDSLADVLPDLYGRKEHAAYMARTARAEYAQNVGRKTAVQLRVRSLMDGLCGKHRGMED